MRLVAFVLALTSVFAVTGASAASKAWWFDFEAGIEFDDNVTVDDDDSSVRLGDVAATFEVDSGYDLLNEDSDKVSVGLDAYRSFYQDLGDFDFQSVSPSISGSTRIGDVKLAGSYTFTHSMLGDYFFFAEHELAPSVSYYFRDNLYLTAFVRFRDRDYAKIDDARDGQTWQPGADLFYYFEQEKRGYVSFGGSYTSEDTRGTIHGGPPVNDDEFDYDGFTLRAVAQIPIDLFDLPGRARLSYVYQRRDYDNVTPSIGVRREEDRKTLRGLVELRFTDDLRGMAEYRFIDRDSNLPSADYRQNVADLSLRYSF